MGVEGKKTSYLLLPLIFKFYLLQKLEDVLLYLPPWMVLSHFLNHILITKVNSLGSNNLLSQMEY